jgi:hypothetical protein
MSNPTPDRRWKFPIARRVIAFCQHWRERHQHPVNFALHVPGIPLAYLGLLLLILAPLGLSGGLAWYWGLAAFAGGFFLQWLGHCFEGNDVGEWIPVKRALGLPVVAIAPRYARPPA